MLKNILMLVGLPLILSAQFISIKSLPVATGDQFMIYPSQNVAMGGVTIAVSDNWMDPYRNPANGFKTDQQQVFLQPTFYHITNNLGGARTIPATAFPGAGYWRSA